MLNQVKSKGGKREGAGRKPNRVKNLAKSLPPDIAGLVLVEIDAQRQWLKLIRSSDERIVLDTMKYLTDRAHGKPKQAVEHSGGVDADVVHRIVFSR